MKEELKVTNSKAYPLYLLHNDLTSPSLAKRISVKNPETRRATHEQLYRAKSSMWQNSDETSG